MQPTYNKTQKQNATTTTNFQQKHRHAITLPFLNNKNFNLKMKQKYGEVMKNK
jgi:hypothetical protein